MQYAVHHRLKLDELAHDTHQLERVYAELADRQPSWVRCQSLRLGDDGAGVLLIDVDDMDRLAELPRLTHYLETLSGRCEEVPRAGAVDGSIDVTGAVELGLWDPDRP
ncbi:hypothetical protein [Actinomycetospora termitidis]|uniref:Uncharacterized protein n=1 Tax=Actinomycetospora termitidis TaxID=3053470 RepID=A0ABT7ME13_9PSEU|nr:hypothetical protein [Actinomycetospora sp. Odt1-22]MDL5157603.1 hypothetical protein [Actinomycetospora sp. Odt1-22]